MKQFAVYFLSNPEVFPPSVEVYNIQSDNKDSAKTEAFARLRMNLLSVFDTKYVDYLIENQFSIVSIVEVIEPAVIDEYFWTKDMK